ncbi:VCBS repeat-containing protein [Streptomyces sp. NBC_01387]|uniref:FG-GAP repeat domain-containing protein n=1 Tax=unclassified Streptomyces TaxID=2593676 RepID=UPI0022533507|nr:MULTISPECIES: VCBS repeat-containing protein [unclassified Streptomyces]MCX4547615.1 VCBS repeat-containing protein [Streptomyces sp. NBC_01500]WSC19300.1 VCBS repeat-containing protein [Streptomyces sp. NBC_01766]WSV53323.1 VCBS repeat-containing protein [Streptomyces sp. NBC_01014]
MHFRLLGSRFALSALGVALCVGVTAPVSASADSGGSVLGAVTQSGSGQRPEGQAGQALRTDPNTLTSAQLTPPALTRTEVMSRAASWVDLGLVYSNTAYYQGYRMDCSGYASMAWKLGTSLVTGTFNSSGVTEDITKAELKAGDALNNPAAGAQGHIALFEKWTDSSKSAYWGYEFSGSGVHHRKIPYPYFSGHGTFHPVHNKAIVDVSDPGMTNLAAVGDQTGDGIPDIIATKVSNGKLYRYSGPDYSGATRVEIGTGWNSFDSVTAVGDLNGDGVTDIVAAKGDGTLYRYSGPDYTGPARVEIGTGWAAMTSITGVGDLTGDGIPDLLAVEKSSGALYRYSGPNYSGATRVQIGTGWNSFDSVTAVGDLNGDGVTDIIAAKGDGTLYRYSGPDYTGPARVEIGTGWDSMNNLVSPGDLNGDGIPDLLGVKLSTSQLFRYTGPAFSGASRTEIGTGW